MATGDTRPSGDGRTIKGLTSPQVAERVARGETNASSAPVSRSTWSIVRENVFTVFNGILGVLLVVILTFGSWRDALFGIVLVTNTAIGIVQEMRAKLTLDRLSVLGAARARVLRDGYERELAPEDVVRDDVITLGRGDQVVVDGVVEDADGLEVDESLLTGEATPVVKSLGDELLSGSFVVSGRARMRAVRVGDASFANRLSIEARRFTLASSEIASSLDRILRWVVVVLPPAAVLLTIAEARADRPLSDAVTGVVAGLVGMVPQGLVLLTSLAFAVASVTLGRRGVLVQQLAAVEGLARTDVVCIDKTGTLTENALEVGQIERLIGDADADSALGALASHPGEASDPTLAAIAVGFPEPTGWRMTGSVPFSPTRRWSAASFGDHGTWLLGAPDVLLAADDRARALAESLASHGSRVLLLARASSLPAADTAPDATPVALVPLLERIRPDAEEALAYFHEEGVTVKVISGDSVTATAAVARRAGVHILGEPLDASRLPDDPDALADIMETHTVFGRVRPDIKRAMVAALRSRGHAVAMLGDGVNDVLAVKEADLGIAMGSGAPATRAVADVVLLQGDFATLPHIVAEGRRVAADIERVANLFLTKTVYALVLALAVGVAAIPFPLLPRHLSLVASLTIGIPSFFLALEPNITRYRRGLIRRVLRFSLPAGIVVGVATLTLYTLALNDPTTTVTQDRSVATIGLALLGLAVLVLLSRPLDKWRALLAAAMTTGLAGALSIPFVRDFFALQLPRAGTAQVVVVTCASAVAAIMLLLRLVGWTPSPRPPRGRASRVR